MAVQRQQSTVYWISERPKGALPIMSLRRKKSGRSAFSEIGRVQNVLMYLLSGLIGIKVFVLAGSIFTKIFL